MSTLLFPHKGQPWAQLCRSVFLVCVFDMLLSYNNNCLFFCFVCRSEILYKDAVEYIELLCAALAQLKLKQHYKAVCQVTCYYTHLKGHYSGENCSGLQCSHEATECTQIQLESVLRQSCRQHAMGPPITFVLTTDWCVLLVCQYVIQLNRRHVQYSGFCSLVYDFESFQGFFIQLFDYNFN